MWLNHVFIHFIKVLLTFLVSLYPVTQETEFVAPLAIVNKNK